MTELLGLLLGGGFALLWVVGFLTFIVLAYWLPYMAWSATRSVKGIRQELTRLNDILERQGSLTVGAPAGDSADPPLKSGPPQYYTRTGPLEIRRS